MMPCSAARRPFCFLLALCVGLCLPLRAATVGQPVNLGPGVTETVSEIMARRTTRPAQPRTPRQRPARKSQPSYSAPDALKGSQFPAAEETREQSAGARAAPAIGASFLSIARAEALTFPPDTMGGVSPTQILVCLNGRFTLFDRDGTFNSALDVDSDDLFASVRGSAITTDPRVLYDRLSQRWFITMLNEATTNLVMLAVSSGSVISSSSSFTLFQFQHDFNAPTGDGDKGAFADYGTLGIDANALYLGFSIFSKPGTGAVYKGATGFVINKSGLIGGSLNVTAFRHLSTAGQTGIDTPQGVDNDDPNATEGYFIGCDNVISTQLIMYRITGVSGSPVLSTPIILQVPETGKDRKSVVE